MLHKGSPVRLLAKITQVSVSTQMVFPTKVGKVCSISEVWMTSLVYAIVFAQPPTFFTKQGATILDRAIAPAASLQSFSSLAHCSPCPIYDCIFGRRL